MATEALFMNVMVHTGEHKKQNNKILAHTHKVSKTNCTTTPTKQQQNFQTQAQDGSISHGTSNYLGEFAVFW
jgi:hypothetical protein